MNETGDKIVHLPLGQLTTTIYGNSNGQDTRYIILAVDPGSTTGYAWYDPWSGVVECGQLGPYLHHKKLMELIEWLMDYSQDKVGHRRICIVYESFEYRQSDDAVRGELRRYLNQLRRGLKVKLSDVTDKLSDILDIRVGKDGLVLDSREYIGIIRLLDQVHEEITVAPQTASASKFFIKDVKLDALGWLKPTRAMTHARDALRHLLRYMVVTLKVREPITTAWFNNIGVGS